MIINLRLLIFTFEIDKYSVTLAGAAAEDVDEDANLDRAEFAFLTL